VLKRQGFKRLVSKIWGMGMRGGPESRRQRLESMNEKLGREGESS
jgi:hypothetical protein